MTPRRLAMVVSLALVSGVLSAAPAPPQAGLGFLVGAVVDAATGRGVPNAIVRATGRELTQTRVTNDQGHFYFKFLPDGDFTITARRAGYLDGAYGKQRPTGESISVTMVPGVRDLFVRIPLFRPAVISGVVADESGEPLVGVTVRAVRREFADGIWRMSHADPVLTDDQGSFRFFNLVPGEYLVTVPALQVTMPLSALEEIGQSGSLPREFAAVMSVSGAIGAPIIEYDPNGTTATINSPFPTPPDQDGRPAAYRTQYYPGGDRLANAMSIIVGPSEHRGGIYFQMLPYPTTRVSGEVIGPDGPARHQVLRLLFADDEDNGVGTEIAITMSGADGRFMFVNVPAGLYRVDARGRPADAVPMLVPREDGPLLWGHTTIAVDEHPVEDLIVDVHPAPAVAGRIVFETAGAKPAAREASAVSITVSPANGARAPYVTRADGAGRFSIAGVVPGDYTVSTRVPPGWYQKSVRAGAQDEATGFLSVDADRDVSDIVVTLTDQPSRVMGVVRDARAFIALGAAVIVQPVGRSATTVPDARRARVVRAGSDGVYVIDALPPGEYALSALDDAALEGWHETRRLEALRGSGVRVVVKDGETRLIDLRVR